jgi:hypothetical protein
MLLSEGNRTQQAESRGGAAYALRLIVHLPEL